MKPYLFTFFVFAIFIGNAQYSLKDFYTDNPFLDKQIDSIYNTLSERARIGQMIITSYGYNGKKASEVEPLIKAGEVGGVIYLKGTNADHLGNTNKLNELNGGLPLLYSMDAEPSLLGGRISSMPKVLKTKDISSIRANDSIADMICDELNSIGVKLNYAPDCDLSTSNAAIGSRSYGADQATVVKMANSFINTSSANNVLTCAKHFPGHGLVVGDSHYGRVKISGEMKELGVYKELIKNPGLYSVMVGHINVENNARYNTNGIPSSCSPVIIKKLLKEELGFKGLVISDGLGMHALKSVGIPGFEASKAGCDILCMPENEIEVLDAIQKEVTHNGNYAKQIETSIKKIIRMKICLGLVRVPIEVKVLDPRIMINDNVWLEQISDSVFTHVSIHEVDGFGAISSNGVIYIRNGKGLIVDTPMDEKKTKELYEFLKEKWKVKITTHIPGHFHADCTGGLSYLLTQGVKSIANKKTVKLCKKESQALPTQSFEDSLTTNFNGEEVKLMYLGAGHTKDNIVVWFPQLKVLFGGCLIKDEGALSLGFTGDAEINKWSETVLKVQNRFTKAKFVIPGHGKVGGEELFNHTLELIKENKAKND